MVSGEWVHDRDGFGDAGACVLEVVLIIAGLTAGVRDAGKRVAHTAALLIRTDGSSKKVVGPKLGGTIVAHPGAAGSRGDLKGLTGVGSGKERGNS